jgi:hypothetical protein
MSSPEEREKVNRKKRERAADKEKREIEQH